MPDIVFFYAGSDNHATRTQPHAHRGYELLFVESGSCRISFSDGETLSGESGDSFLIPPMVMHDRNNFGKCTTYYAVFEVKSDFPALPRKLHVGDDRLFRDWIHTLPELNRDFASDQAASLIRTLILRLQWLDHQHQHTQRLHTAVRKACVFMEVNYAREITVTDIARSAAVSASHLDLLFRTSLGTSPQKYLAALRMGIARRLLLDPTRNISEIARDSGFEDIHYFSRFFHRFHGMSPSVYRKDPSSWNVRDYGTRIP